MRTRLLHIPWAPLAPPWPACTADELHLHRAGERHRRATPEPRPWQPRARRGRPSRRSQATARTRRARHAWIARFAAGGANRRETRLLVAVTPSPAAGSGWRGPASGRWPVTRSLTG